MEKLKTDKLQRLDFQLAEINKIAWCSGLTQYQFLYLEVWK